MRGQVDADPTAPDSVDLASDQRRDAEEDELVAAEQTGGVHQAHPIGVGADRDQSALVIEVKVGAILLRLAGKQRDHREEVGENVDENGESDYVDVGGQTGEEPVDRDSSQANHRDGRTEDEKHAREKPEGDVDERRS